MAGAYRTAIRRACSAGTAAVVLALQLSTHHDYLQLAAGLRTGEDGLNEGIRPTKKEKKIANQVFD